MSDASRRFLATSRALEEVTRRQKIIDAMIKPSEGAHGILAAVSASEALRRLDEQHRNSPLMAVTHSASFLGALEAHNSLQNATALASQFSVLKEGQASSLSRQLSDLIRPFDKVGLTQAAWAASLAGRMASIPSRWAFDPDREASARSFALLSRFSDYVAVAQPYTDETSEILVQELGEPSPAPVLVETEAQREDRYDLAGRQRDLIAFPAESFTDVVVASGLTVSFPAPPSVELEPDGLQEAARFAPELAAMISSLEAHLRNFIVSRLQAQGDGWFKQRVPKHLRGEWLQRQTAAKEAGRIVLSPIHYAHFIDLLDVMSFGVNWPLFQAEFVSKENLQVSLRRLYFIRNDLAHSRPVGRSDLMMTVTEGTLLFRAMGMPVHHPAF